MPPPTANPGGRSPIFVRRKSTGLPARRGPFEPGRPLLQTCGVKEARRAPTSQIRVRILAGLPLSRAGVARLSGRAVCCQPAAPLRFKSAPDRIPRPRQNLCCGPATLPLSTPNRQVAGSNPARSIRAPVAQWSEQFGRHTTTAAVIQPRAGTRWFSGRAPGAGPGGRRVRSLPPFLSTAGVAQNTCPSRNPRPWFLATRERRRRRCPT